MSRIWKYLVSLQGVCIEGQRIVFIMVKALRHNSSCPALLYYFKGLFSFAPFGSLAYVYAPIQTLKIHTYMNVYKFTNTTWKYEPQYIILRRSIRWLKAASAKYLYWFCRLIASKFLHHKKANKSPGHSTSFLFLWRCKSY